MEGKTAKVPVKFLCRSRSDSYSIVVEKTQNHYRFWKGQNYLVKIEEDIEFFDDHELFLRTIDEADEKDIKNKLEKEVKEKQAASKKQVKGDLKKAKGYSQKDLQKMEKSELRATLKLLSNKDCPVKKNNIINLILEVQ